MKIATEIGSVAPLVGEEKAVELIAKAGFDAWDFTMFSMCTYDRAKNEEIITGHPLTTRERLTFARRLKQIGLDCGITCNQSHAPFPVRLAPVRDRLKYAIECTAEAGGSICVIHPDNNKGAKENAEMYLELLPFAKEHNVKIATENMWNWNEEFDHAAPAACSSPESFLAHLVAAEDDFFVACLDIGHAEMMGDEISAAKMVYALKGKLQALHIHDNHRRYDEHLIPFGGTIDFASIAKALKAVGYNGYFTLEAQRHMALLPDSDETTVLRGLQELAEADRKFAQMFENA